MSEEEKQEKAEREALKAYIEFVLFSNQIEDKIRRRERIQERLLLGAAGILILLGSVLSGYIGP